jgi:hypothetical protein
VKFSPLAIHDQNIKEGGKDKVKQENIKIRLGN